MISRSSTSRSEIAEREPGIPVDHPVVAVDQALVVELDEHLHHRAHVAGVEREALLGVVERGPEALELLEDQAAVLLAPAPRALDERVAAERLARRALAAQQPLHLRLGGDPGVVGAHRPLDPLPAHPVVADQRVLDGAVEGVAHVQRPGHVRRRHGDREVLLRRPLRLGMEHPGGEPAREDLGLALGRLPALAVLQAGHTARESRRAAAAGPARRRRRRARTRPAPSRPSGSPTHGPCRAGPRCRPRAP